MVGTEASLPPTDSKFHEAHRRLTALLKWRRRRFNNRCRPTINDALHVLPWFLSASFKEKGFDAPAPGVEDFQASQKLHKMHKRMGMPALLNIPSNDVTASALVGIPRGDVFDLVLIYRPGSKADAIARLRRRLPFMQIFFKRKGLRLRFHHWEVMSDASKDKLMHQIMFKGFFIAGCIPARFWRRAPLNLLPPLLWSCFQEAPSNTVQKMALFFAQKELKYTCEELVMSLSKDVPAYILADSDLLAAHWATKLADIPAVLHRALALEGKSEARNGFLLEQMNAPSAGKKVGPTPPHGLAALMQAHLQLVKQGRQILAALPQENRDEGRAYFRQHVLAAGVPDLLRPLFAAAMREYPQPKDGETPWHLDLKSDTSNKRFEVAAPCGAVVGQGHKPEQALLRALTFIQNIFGQLPVLPAGHLWRKLGPHLKKTTQRRHALLLVDGEDHPGPPNDVLNRGAERRCTLSEAWLYVEKPHLRPSLSQISGLKVPFCMHRCLRRQMRVEVQGLQSSGEIVLARLNRLRDFMAARLDSPRPLVVEIGGTVWTYQKQHWQHTEHPFEKPSYALVDPEAPDINAVPRAEGAPGRDGQTRVLDCALLPLGGEQVKLLFHDPKDYRLALIRPLETLNTYLSHVQTWLRDMEHPLVLKTHTDADFTNTLNRAQLVEPKTLSIALSGAFPNSRVLQIGARTFEETQDPGFQKALSFIAQTVASEPGRPLIISQMSVDLPQSPAAALFAIYAASAMEKWLMSQINPSAGT